MVKSTEGLVREAEIEFLFQLPAGFTSSALHACPPTQSWFMFSEFCGVTLTWDKFMFSLPINEQNNFGREKHGNSCFHYLAVTCAAQERMTPPTDTGFMVKKSTEFKERTEHSKIWEPGILRSKYLQTWPGYPVLSVQGPMCVHLVCHSSRRRSQTHFSYGVVGLFWREGGRCRICIVH